MGYYDFMLCPIYCYCYFYLFYVYLFIGFATQPIVKLHACNVVRISNNRCCQNYLARGPDSPLRACLARMCWGFTQGLGRVIAHNYQEGIVACNAKWI